LCYGQAVSRTTYADLYAVVGTTYGSGDGSTSFNLPDLRGRVIAGQDDMGGLSANRLTGTSGGVDGDVLGASGGFQQHTLITNEMPIHTHLQNGHQHSITHTHSIDHNHPAENTSSNGSHDHDLDITSTSATAHGHYSAASTDGVAGEPNTTTSTSVATNVVIAAGSHTHELNLPNFTGTSGGSSAANTGSQTATNQDTGGNQPHNNVQPTFILNYIIKT